MGYNTKTFYKVNKDEPNKIIYPTVVNAEHYIELKDGIVREVYINYDNHSEDYSVICKDMDEKQFANFKQLSDEDFLNEQRSENNYLRNKRNIDGYTNSTYVSECSVEEMLINKLQEIENDKEHYKKLCMSNEILNLLTEKQKKRFLLHYISGKSTYEIAEVENVANTVIWRSVNAANKKIKKYFEKSSENRVIKPQKKDD